MFTCLQIQGSEVYCHITEDPTNPPANNSEPCIVKMEKIASPSFSYNIILSIFMHVPAELTPSQDLVTNPHNLTVLMLLNFTSMSQVSMVMQHFNVVNLTVHLHANGEHTHIPLPAIMDDPYNITKLNLTGFTSISQIFTVLQHFKFVGDNYPIVENNSDVF